MKQLLRKIKSHNILLEVVDGKLKVFASETPDPALLAEIREKKDDLLRFLSGKDEPELTGSFTSGIPAIPQAESYPLSASQQMLWVVSQFEEANVGYNNPGAFIFEGSLDFPALSASFDALVERHENLRTVFREDETGGARQFIRSAQASGFSLAYHDLRGQDDRNERVRTLVQHHALSPFDLAEGPLLRAALFQLEENKWVFSYVMHHIISDGWSMDILMRELLQLYNARIAGQENPLTPLRIQYKDYTAWQLDQLSGDAVKAHRNWWLQQFEGGLPVLELSGGKPRPAIKTYNGAAVTCSISAETTGDLKSICRQQGATLFMGVLAAVDALLYKYTGQEDIVIGSPIAGRQHTDLEDQIGFYVNTLAFRTRFTGQNSYLEVLEQVKQFTLGAYEHQVFPFAELVEALQLQRDMSRNPLFDVQVILGNTYLQDAGSAGSLGGLAISPYIAEQQFSSRFDIMFTFMEQGEGLGVNIVYNPDIYTQEVMLQLSRHLQQMLAALSQHPSLPIGQLQYLDNEEKHQLLEKFNNTSVDFPAQKTITSLFEEQVAATPNNIAVAFEEKELSYKELNEQSNRFAAYLRNQYNIQANDLVAVKLHRSEQMIVSLLAVLKSGGAYVPIDPEYPQERIDYMISDSNCKLVIDEQELEKFRSEEKNCDSSNPAAVSGPSDLAYVIYTSGTTGKPKGSLIDHRNVVRLFKTGKPLFDFNEKDVWTVFHSFCFDFSVWEMYGALLFGGKTVVVSKAVAQDTSAYRQLLLQHKVTVLNQTPSAFYNLIREELENETSDLHIRYVIFGGEALSPGRLKEWKEKYPAAKLVNMYGITETTVHVTYKEITQKEIEENVSNIGKPIPTLSCYVLDQNGQLVPPGIWGELYVGGEGVCRGYLNRPELTAQRFLSNPFKTGEQLYRSGDRVRLLQNGELEYGGRMDGQVKIRGYRIELGEIESVLQSHPGVESSVVVARSAREGEKELVAYVTGVQELSTIELRTWLLRSLPAYMIPAHYVHMEALPLTANGKVDRKALPDPEEARLDSGTQYMAPQTEIEKCLVAVYEEVLRRQPIGIREDFFMLGGDSIKSIQIVSRVKQRGYALAIQNILLYPTIEELVVHVKPLVRQADQATVTGEIALSPIQHWFFNKELSAPHHNNQSVLLFSKTPLVEEGIKAVFGKLVLHHDALRMVFRQTPSDWVQENKGKEQGYGFEMLPYDETTFAENCDRIQSTINLEEGPLFKVALFQGSDGDRLLMVAHHLVIDGVSWRILFEDISALYQQYATGAVLALPSKTDPFQYWQEKQLEYAASEKLAEEEAYWSAIESLPIKPLPQDYQNGSNTVQDAVSLSGLLDGSLTERLLTRSYHAYRTEVNDVLLTALSLALGEVFGLDKILIGMEGHGREDIGADVDVSRTVGWFTTIYPVALDMSHKKDIIRQLIEVKETLHRIPNKGIGYGVLRYLAGKDYKAKPEISFNYLGDFGSGISTEQGEQLFEFSGEYQGREVPADMHRTSLLSVSGMVVGGQLRLTVDYSQKQFEAATIRLLLDSCQQHLKSLVDRLSSEENTHLTPVDLTCKDLTIDEVRELDRRFRLEDAYPLSPLQEGLYYHWISSPEAYFEQMSYQLSGNMDMAKIGQSYQALVARHAVLRTCFREDFGQGLLQVVQKEVPSTLRYIDMTAEKNLSVEAFKEADKTKRFELGSGSQMRLTVLALGNGLYEFIWSYHHILMDGWCVSVLINEFYEIYHSLVYGREPKLDKLYPYSNYIKWLSSINKESSFHYWRDYLEGYDTISSLPRTKAKEEGEFLNREVRFALDQSIRQSIKTLCEELGVTENTFMQTMWGILLGRYNNTGDVVFGSVVSGRPPEVEKVEQIVGLFINTIPVRIRVDAEKSVREILKEVQQASIEGIPHHYTQLADIQAQSQLGRDLLDHLLVFENYPMQQMVEDGMAAQEGEEQFSLLSVSTSDHTNYDFSITVMPGDEIIVTFRYNGRAYDRGTMERLQQHFSTLVKRVLEQPAKAIREIEYVDEAEKDQLLLEFNSNVPLGYPENKTVLDLFEERVKENPAGIAVVFGKEQLTYQQLDEQSNRLANYLIGEYNIRPGDHVALMTERSEKLIIALLAILKTGAAYVPVDPAYPVAKRHFILQNAAIRLLITESAFLLDLTQNDLQLFALDIQLDDLDTPVSAPIQRPGPQHLAYLIYTSGSTGTPKGCAVTHDNLFHYTYWANRNYFNSAHGHFGLFTSLSFDLTVTSVFCSLTRGKRLFIYGQHQELSGILAHSFSAESGIDSIKLTPSHINMLRHMELSSSTIGCAIVGGEELLSTQVEVLKKINPAMEIYNEYGPTEATVGCVVYRAEEKEPVLIGKPMDHASIYVLDAKGKLCGIGVAGEICIGGKGVAAGYLRQPELTQEKFVADPFRAGERMYRSGDAGRWRNDGQLEFLGRKDEQLKIRGYRIEPGEIEVALQAYEGVEAGVVIGRTVAGAEPELVAYLVGRKGLSAQELRSYLASVLPAHMIPTHFVQVEALPLTPNGKVDRKKLPDPQTAGLGTGVEYVAPRNETEEKLVLIWQEVLGRERIGMKDSFFDLGGHSLKVIQVISRINIVFQLRINIRDVFDEPTIESLAGQIDFLLTQKEQRQNKEGLIKIKL